MGSPIPSAPPSRHLGTRFGVQLWSFLAGPMLDERLAGGVSPSASHGLSQRARRITRPAARRRLADALRLRIEAANTPASPLSPKIPVDRTAVLSCREQIEALADRIATAEHPRARGVAIARQLAFDGLAPLYWRPEGNRDGATRLAGTIESAQRALEVSPDFD
jgi:hypothetical protein